MPAVDPADVDACLRVLAAAAEGALPRDVAERVEQAAGAVHRAGKKRLKAQRAAMRDSRDRALVASARRFRDEIPAADQAGPHPERPTAEASAQRMLGQGRRCYVCKERYLLLDTDYHLLCPECARLNAQRRDARCDLTGRRAVVTGGRVKIGFHTALKLLRDGADVLVTTRFPADAARRYARLPDFADWSHRLHLHGVDLLDLPAVLDLVGAVQRRWDGLDILINNAAQTLHRPAGYHREVRAAEQGVLTGPAARLELTRSGGFPSDSGQFAGLPAVIEAMFPAGRLDETGQPLDLREVNSWVLRDAEVTPHEWLQVHVINAFVPFLLTSRLRPLLAAADQPHRHVVQVSAMEGSYSRGYKSERHPHTNMAKAGLNMLVRTVAADYRRSGIFMNAVDTGWVTDERPHPAKAAQREAGFRPPLDVIDGAARVYDPIVRGVRGEPVFGRFLKDYRSVEW
jgi:NAD(P)-dependent dehydrogenase (short-subunit alcohol dehydrogenase family)